MQIVVILAACRAVGWLGKRVGQPQVVGEMVAGLLLGPSLLGLVLPRVQQWLFPADSRAIIYVCAQVGLVLYMFLMGATFRVDLALGRARAAAAVSLAGIVAPFALGAILAWGLHGNPELYPEGVTLAQAAMFMGASMSITAFPMLARIIEEQGLVGTQLGALALAAASLDDVLAWCALAVVMASGGSGGGGEGGGGGGWWIAARAIGGGGVFVVVVFYVLRPLLKRLGEGLTNTKVDSVWPISPARLAVVLVLLFAAAWCTDAIGVHAVFGAFLLGLAMPRGEFAQRLHRMVGPVTTAAPAAAVLRLLGAQHADRADRDVATGGGGCAGPGRGVCREVRGLLARGPPEQGGEPRIAGDRGADERAGDDGADHPEHRARAGDPDAHALFDRGCDGRGDDADGDARVPDVVRWQAGSSAGARQRSGTGACFLA